VQPGDERTHQARLAHAGREGKAQRGKIAVEARHLRELAAQCSQGSIQIGRLGERQQLAHACQDLE
jgi:hypothetical protein